MGGGYCSLGADTIRRSWVELSGGTLPVETATTGWISKPRLCGGTAMDVEAVVSGGVTSIETHPRGDLIEPILELVP